MPASLPTAGEIVSTGWSQYLKDWKHLFEISIRFLFAALIVFIAGVSAERLPDGPAVFVWIAGNLIGGAVSVHAVIVLIEYALRREAKPEGAVPIETKAGWVLFWPMIWIGVLSFFAVLGGFIALVLPAFWLSVLFSFAPFILVEQNRRGTQALAASAELVRGRWWMTLWRLLVPALAVTVLALLVSLVLYFVIGFVVGFDRVFGLARAGADIAALSPGVEGTKALLRSIIETLLIPLSIIYQVKLYRALKETR